MPADPTDRIALMRAFADMYRAKQFDRDGFDDDGYLQTTLSDDDRMPLEFFIEYNNAWWFEIISGVDVPHVAYDPESDSGSIVLDIDYAGDTLRAMQHVQFGAGRINRIRTYASGAFFLGSSPLVRLDRYGNAVWLETGYDLGASLRAALAFLDTPHGRAFAAEDPTARPVARIRANLAELESRLTG
ncbi:hypothetical protein VSS74_05070 [Conexibacter stalactiti]|uniref:SnoaL-like domain-containing protein n=1 Tax=Conexibacter stalactiti TaxID=1940611 RepID=A0ABU4HK71_9ACTN|nr:hypothetical protein [Conexibacter stalactiti]MDW5593696.1 hypothetical protein [Conexibacter stalactiti]MEC5034337.1 hypothetical protein [Conexibacter stalactiti]